MVDFPASHVSFRGCTSFPDQSDTMHQTYKALHESTLLGLPFVAGPQIRDVDSGCFRGRCGFLFEGMCIVCETNIDSQERKSAFFLGK